MKKHEKVIKKAEFLLFVFSLKKIKERKTNDNEQEKNILELFPHEVVRKLCHRYFSIRIYICFPNITVIFEIGNEYKLKSASNLIFFLIVAPTFELVESR